MTKFDKYFMWFLVGTILLILMLGIFACTTTKHIEKETESITEVSKVNIDSIVKIKVDSVASHYQEFLNQLEADVVFSDCDTVLLPGETKIVNTVTYVPGKGIVATGNIKQFKLKQEELIKLIDEITIEKENEINLRIRAEDSLKYYHSLKTLDKKTKSIWWIWFIAGAFTMFCIWKRKFILSLFKGPI
jgi:heme/copper-type cytochrome/quinol oxidase subunit 2